MVCHISLLWPVLYLDNRKLFSILKHIVTTNVCLIVQTSNQSSNNILMIVCVERIDDMESIKVLILGGSGMLGHKLFMHLSNKKNFEVFTTVRSNDFNKFLPESLLSSVVHGVDAGNFLRIVEVLKTIKPQVVINCIGIVKQSSVADNALLNISINALLPHHLAQTCRERGIRLIHISTDCVFAGTKGYYTEDEAADATDLYGRTKLLGEVAHPHTLTLRTSIIGHELQTKQGLVEWFLAQTERVQGYCRHTFSGFPTIELAKVLADHIIPNTSLSGVYHLSSQPISKYELLNLIAWQYGKSIVIEPYYDTFCDRSLNSQRLRSLINYSAPSWPDMVAAMQLDYLYSPYYQ
jgi:dTDP-4-dehydrorhamnose reductase